MKFLLTLLIMTSSTFLFSQDTFTEANAKGIVDTFFEGFHEGDTLKMRSVMAPAMKMQTVFANKDGNHVKDDDMNGFVKAIGKRPESQKWEEKLLDYKVQIDGNLAHVWTPYEFWLNGDFSHCGANAFTLAKMNDGWKIVHLIDSRRRASCNQ